MGLKFNVNKYVADRGQTRINRKSVNRDTTTTTTINTTTLGSGYKNKKTIRRKSTALTKANRDFLRLIANK